VWAGDVLLANALAPFALAMTGAAALVRAAALTRNASLKARSSLQSATGIKAARLQQVSMGMMGGSFNTREFFHHASALMLRNMRWAFVLLLFVLPLLCLLWAWQRGGGLAWQLALACQVPGVLAERWFFFAQARHPQNLYYQRIG
jgi:sulfite dehydrogenase (quinone) subunit SoeC